MTHFTYSDPVNAIATSPTRNMVGYVRHTSRKAVSVALVKEHLSDQLFGTKEAPCVDITDVGGNYIVDTGNVNPQSWETMSRLLIAADTQLKIMASVTTYSSGR